MKIHAELSNFPSVVFRSYPHVVSCHMAQSCGSPGNRCDKGTPCQPLRNTSELSPSLCFAVYVLHSLTDANRTGLKIPFSCPASRSCFGRALSREEISALHLHKTHIKINLFEKLKHLFLEFG